MKKTILTLVGIGLLVVWSAMAQTNPCIWNPWTVATAPTISVTVNSPGNQCIGTQVSVTATAATTDGTKTRTDNCGNSQTAALTLSIPTWTWSLSGITANVTSGTITTPTLTPTATFTSTSAGTATVTFTATATTTDPNGTYSANNSATFTVVAVAALLPDQGTELDDADNNPNTKTFIVCPTSSGVITVTATPTPAIAEANLPSCWILSGGTGTGKLVRTVDKSSAGTTTITSTAGSSSRSVTLIVGEQASSACLDFLDPVINSSQTASRIVTHLIAEVHFCPPNITINVRWGGVECGKAGVTDVFLGATFSGVTGTTIRDALGNAIGERFTKTVPFDPVNGNVNLVDTLLNPSWPEMPTDPTTGVTDNSRRVFITWSVTKSGQVSVRVAQGPKTAP